LAQKVAQHEADLVKKLAILEEQHKNSMDLVIGENKALKEKLKEAEETRQKNQQKVKEMAILKKQLKLKEKINWDQMEPDVLWNHFVKVISF
jgi:hypothetical protein